MIRATTAVAIVVAIGLGAYGYYLIETEVKERREEAKAAAIATPAAPPPPPGIPAAPVAPLPGVIASSSENAVQLVLASVSPGSTPQEGVASIGTSLDDTQQFAAGGLLPNGARLTEVHSDHVILSKGSARIAVYMGDREPKVLGTDQRFSERQTVEQNLLFVGGKASAREEIKPAAGYTWSTTVLTQPVFDQGRLKGIQVLSGASASQLASLGFNSGDVVLEIDGVRVEDPAQGEDLLGALESGDPVAVTVERDGSLHHLMIDPKASRSSPRAPPVASAEGVQ